MDEEKKKQINKAIDLMQSICVEHRVLYEEIGYFTCDDDCPLNDICGELIIELQHLD